MTENGKPNSKGGSESEVGQKPKPPTANPPVFVSTVRAFHLLLERYCSFTNSHPIEIVSLLITVIFGLFGMLVLFSFFQYIFQKAYIVSEREQITHDFKAFKKQVQDSTYSLVYSNNLQKIHLYAQDLQSSNPDTVDNAIWRLSEILNDIEKNFPELYERDIDKLFVDLLNKLDLTFDLSANDAKQAQYRDSYRGRVWIWVLLLKSNNEHIKMKMREILYGKNIDAVLDKAKIFQKQIGQNELPDLEAGIAQLRPLLQKTRQ